MATHGLNLFARLLLQRGNNILSYHVANNHTGACQFIAEKSVQEQIDALYIEQLRLDIAIKEEQLQIMRARKEHEIERNEKEFSKLGLEVEVLRYKYVKFQTELGAIQIVDAATGSVIG